MAGSGGPDARSHRCRHPRSRYRGAACVSGGTARDTGIAKIVCVGAAGCAAGFRPRIYLVGRSDRGRARSGCDPAVRRGTIAGAAVGECEGADALAGRLSARARTRAKAFTAGFAQSALSAADGRLANLPATGAAKRAAPAAVGCSIGLAHTDAVFGGRCRTQAQSAIAENAAARRRQLRPRRSASNAHTRKTFALSAAGVARLRSMPALRAAVTTIDAPANRAG